MSVAVIIVGYGNADDIAACLAALANSEADPGFAVFICENGGPGAWRDLTARLSQAQDSPCAPADVQAPIWPADSVSRAAFQLSGVQPRLVYAVQAPDNLGYAGGVNFWLRPLLQTEGPDAFWVLNPDCEPDRFALAELASACRAQGKGMVGSCMVQSGPADVVATRGLRWRPWRATPEAVGRGEAVGAARDPNGHGELSAPSGASMYVTRSLIERIGLMEDSYFLFYEDLEWGERAQRLGQLGHADGSRVRHHQGSTTGSAQGPARRSPLAVYLMTRNSILFVRRNHPRWLVWTVVAHLLHSARFAVSGSLTNARVGLRGLLAGIAGETGPPARQV